MRQASLRKHLSAKRLRYPALAAWLLCAACAASPQENAPPVAAAKPQPVKPVPAPLAQAPAPLATSAPRVKVALLLPLTGSSATLGQAMLDSANLAVYDQAGKSFELLPEDTGDTPEKAKRAAEHAVAAGAKLILGPLFSASVASVAPVATAAHVNVVSFTTDAAQARDNVFVMGFLPGQEVQRVVSFAQRGGLQGFAALAPENAYGNLTATALEAAAPGATVVRYPPGAADLNAEVQQLQAGHPNALLLPEGGDKLRMVTKTITAEGLGGKQLRLLGTGLWDDSALGQEPTLIGGWYAGTDPTARAAFEQRFAATYKYKPQRLATLSYDATALAIVLARDGNADPFAAAAIAKPSGFAGIDGVFRFDANGRIERELSVLQVGANGPIVIDPAPKSFGMTKMGM